MADEAKAAPAPEASAGGGKKLPLKTIIIVMAMLVVEAGVLVAALSMFGGPSKAVADDGVVEPSPDALLVEIPVVHEKFNNSATGRVWLWDTEVLIQVREKDQPAIEDILTRRQAEIRTGISAIVASAQHGYFTEPGRKTLTRQLEDYLREVFKQRGETESRVAMVLIPKCVGMPADF
ncbi:MAG: hypothetical protein KDA16_03035 [Phycisphaerales bacterium]|nr:hypothetical protein [Phycisphaerales bacterium]